MPVPEVKVKISAQDASRSVLSSVQRNLEGLRGQFVEGGAAAVRAATGTGMWEAGLQKLSIQQAQSTNYTNRWTAGLRALQTQQASATAGTVMAGSAAVRGVEGYRKFGTALTSVGLRMVGVSGQAGKLAEGVLLMGLGGPVTLAVAAGLAILGAGYMLLTKRTRQAREEQEKLNEEVDRSIAARNPIPILAAQATGYAKQIEAIDDQLAVLWTTNGTKVNEFVGSPDGGMFISRQIDNTKEIIKLTNERATAVERLKNRELELNDAFESGLPEKKHPKKSPKPEIFDNTNPRGDGNTVAGGGLGIAAQTAGGILGGRMRPGGPNTNGKSPLREALEKQAADALAALNEIKGQLTQGIADSIGDGIANGFAAALSRGGLKAGFKALLSSLLTGIGNAMVAFGKASLAAAIKMEIIKKSLASFLPGGAIAASIAMIALGGALGGAASAAFGGDSSSSGYSARGLTDTVTRVTVSPTPASQSAASITAQRPVVYSPILIGTTDQTAQRQLVEMMNLAGERGHRIKGRPG